MKPSERFRYVIEYTPNAMLMVSSTGLIEMVNINAEQLFGYERSELLGKSVECLLPEHFRDGHEGHRSDFFAPPTQSQRYTMGTSREFCARRKDGSEFRVEIALNSIETENGAAVLAEIRLCSPPKTGRTSVKSDGAGTPGCRWRVGRNPAQPSHSDRAAHQNADRAPAASAPPTLVISGR